MRGNGYEVHLDTLCRPDHANLAKPQKISVEGRDLCTQHQRLRMSAVLARRHTVGGLKGSGKCLMGGKPIIERNIQNPPVGVPDLLQSKCQFSISQILFKLHAGNFPEFPCHMEFGIAKPGRKRLQGQLFIPVLPDPPVDFIHDCLNLSLPFVHWASPL